MMPYEDLFALIFCDALCGLRLIPRLLAVALLSSCCRASLTHVVLLAEEFEELRLIFV